MNIIRIAIATLLAVVLWACGSNSGDDKTSIGKVDPSEIQKNSITRPTFEADSAVNFLKRQCGFGCRVPQSEAHERCAVYLHRQLSSYCDTAFVQSFDAVNYAGEKWKGTNLIGQIHPEMIRRVALFAHWDCRSVSDNDEKANWHKPVLGANDGASGVAVLLEVARQLQLGDDSLGVDIVFLDLEDGGRPSFEVGEKEDTWCLGSQYLAKNPYYKNGKPEWGILLDMVGGKSPFFGFDEVSLYFAETRLRQVWQHAQQLGYGNAFVPQMSGSIMDDHYYINLFARIPTIDIIDYHSERGFPETWHTQQDIPENIDPNTLKMVGEVVLKTLREQ